MPATATRPARDPGLVRAAAPARDDPACGDPACGDPAWSGEAWAVSLLDGTVVLVVVGGTPVGAELAAGLAEAGATVVRIGPGGDEDAGSVDAEVADLADPVLVRAAVDEAVAVHGRLDAVVHAAFEPAALHPRPFVEIEPEVCAEAWERSVWSTLATLQAGHARLADQGGVVLVVTSTVGDVGAAGFGPWAAAIGAQRALVRSAARQWGEQGISVLALAPDATLVGEHDVPPHASLAGPALGAVASPDDVAHVAALLLSQGARALTGQTVTVDGGSWMAP